MEDATFTPSPSLSFEETGRSALQLLERGRADLANPYIDALMTAGSGNQFVRRLYARAVKRREQASRNMARMLAAIGGLLDAEAA